MRTVFQNAKNSAPCVLFFDEIDSLCPSRGTESSGSSNHMSRLTNQMLTEMDGLNTRENVFVLAATNRAEMIDKAVLRPGRFDKIVKVAKPQANDRKLILQKHLSKIPKISQIIANQTSQTNEILDELSSDEITGGLSGAELAGLVKEASLFMLKDILSSSICVSERFQSIRHLNSLRDEDVLNILAQKIKNLILKQ